MPRLICGSNWFLGFSHTSRARVELQSAPSKATISPGESEADRDRAACACPVLPRVLVRHCGAMFPLRDEITALAGCGRPPSVALVRAGALGDTILLLPAVQRILDALPQARLTLVGSQWARELIPLLPRAWEFLPFGSPDLTPLFRPDGGRVCPPLLREQDVVVVYSAEPEGVFVGNLDRACRGRVIGWPVQVPRGMHAACHFAAAVAPAPPAESDLPLPALVVAQEARTRAERWLSRRLEPDGDPLVVVHPGSGGERKRWPAPMFAELVARMRRKGARVVLLQGPADGRACRAVGAALAASGLTPVATPTSVEEAAALISCADAFVGNDSGVSHLAAAVGALTTTVFGPTDPVTWRPLGRSVLAVRGAAARKGGAWPSVAEALEAVLRHARGR